MAEEKMALLDLLRKGEEPAGDVLVEGVRWLLQELMDAEVSAQIGAGRYERNDERTTQRNGYRTRPWDTRLGTLELAIPKLRQGSYFPSWLEPRPRAEQALVAVVAEAYVQGVSTRKVEALVQSLGIAGLSKSEVSRLCTVLDDQARIFRTRPLDAVYPYIWVDARYEHVREAGRVVSMAVVVAYGVRADVRLSLLSANVELLACLNQCGEHADKRQLDNFRDHVEQAHRFYFARRRAHWWESYGAANYIQDDDANRAAKTREIEREWPTWLAKQQQSVDDLRQTRAEEESAVTPPFFEMLRSGREVDDTRRSRHGGRTIREAGKSSCR
jgi:hypothetical protein